MNIFDLPVMTYIIIFIVLILFVALSANVNKDSYNSEDLLNKIEESINLT